VHLTSVRIHPLLRFAALCLLSPPYLTQTQAQEPLHTAVAAPVDSDGDGLSDALEQTLLNRFAPNFQIALHDCSDTPVEFTPNEVIPQVKAEDRTIRTIYGQVSPARSSTTSHPVAEIHFYHLWQRDCGPHGHPLDTEHVAVLVRASGPDLSSATWTAAYWYAAAHEDTVCDVSQIARASTLKAEDRGAKVWISPGKHASYLNQTLCQRGCGADRCEQMVPLHANRFINLGEPNHPMNGSLFIASSRWPLLEKMQNTNFPALVLARLDTLPDTDIAWFNPGRHPVQGVIAISSTTGQSLATSGRNTSNSLSEAGDSTDVAISVAGDSTRNALQKSYHKTAHALGVSTRHVGDALHLTPKPDQPQ
jgi:hypothetical protein